MEGAGPILSRALLGALLLGLCAAGVRAAPLVALDVGHALVQPGATSARGVPEFEFNRSLARVVAAELERRGMAVRLIGAEGAATDLEARAHAAAGAQLLLSLHHDSVQEQYLRPWRPRGKPQLHSDRFRGYSLFISRKNPRAAASLQCAAAIGFALRGAGFAPTRHHAEPIAGERRAWADYAAGVYYFDDLLLLRSAQVPAVLFEAGVIVNRRDERRLADPAYRARLARALGRGVGACLARAPGTPPAQLP